MPAVSLVVPVYNAEQYLADCIESILAQTFTDFELILVDDGSPDRCPEICDGYARQDTRIRVLHQENQGQSAARNNAVDQSCGEWICFIDSDDLIHPQMLEYLYNGVTEGNALISMCDHEEGITASADFYNACNNKFSIITMSEELWVSLYDKEMYPCWVIWKKLIHRDIILKYPFCEGRIYEDNAIVCYWFNEAKKIVHIPQKMYFYRVNPTGTTKSSFNIKKLDYLWALEEIIQFCGVAEMPLLRERFCTRYLKMAFAFRYQLEDCTDRKEIIKKIQTDTVSFLKKETIMLTKEQSLLILDLLLPGFAHIRELVDSCIQQIKSVGIWGVLYKVLNFFKKRGYK